MRKLRIWFFQKFLPAYCREELTEENKRLIRKISDLKQENAKLGAYINGMQDAAKLGRRIRIYTGGAMSDGPVDCTDR